MKRESGFGDRIKFYIEGIIWSLGLWLFLFLATDLHTKREPPKHRRLSVVRILHQSYYILYMPYARDGLGLVFKSTPSQLAAGVQRNGKRRFSGWNGWVRKGVVAHGFEHHQIYLARTDAAKTSGKGKQWGRKIRSDGNLVVSFDLEQIRKSMIFVFMANEFWEVLLIYY